MAISMTISTLNSYPSLKSPQTPFKTLKFRSPFPQFTTQSFKPRLIHAFPPKKFGNSLFSTKNNNNNLGLGLGLGFCLNSQNVQAQGESGEALSEAEIKDFSQSSLPERFRYNPGWNPLWLIYLLASLSFLMYSPRIMRWEVGNWRKLASTIISFSSDNLSNPLKVVLAPLKVVLAPVKVVLAPVKVVLARVAIPLISLMRGLKPTLYYIIATLNYIKATTLYSIKATLYIIKATLYIIEATLYNIGYFYKGIISSAPIGDLTLIIILASIMLAIAETVVPDSINSQPYVMTIAGLAGYATVKGLITATFFSTILMGLFIFSRFIKKKDYVSSTLPSAVVLAAIGEPLVQVFVMVSFSALAINHHQKNPLEEKEREAYSMGNSLPFPLVCAGLAIGLRVAAKWAHHMHLTWMVV